MIGMMRRRRGIERIGAALLAFLLLFAGCAGAEKKGWTQEEWENVIMALASDDEEPVPESRRVSFRSGWLPSAEKGFINLLLISSDAPDIDRNFGRADAILVCRTNLWTGETRLLSLPEDALTRDALVKWIRFRPFLL